MNKKILLTIIVITLFFTINMKAQKSISLGFYNGSIGIPFTYLTKSTIHPALQVGVTLRESGQKWKKSFGVDAYYHYQRLTEHSLMLDGNFHWGYQFGKDLRIRLTTALGAKLVRLPGTEYKLENGNYIEANHPGSLQGNMKLGLGLTYPLSTNLMITTDYKFMVSGPSGGLFLPININTFFGIGLNYHI